MEQTTNRSLNIWDDDDPVDVSQINANFQTLDGPNAVLLRTTTLGGTGTSMTASLASVDWSKYREVTVRCYYNGSGNCTIRSNSSGSLYDRALYLGGSNVSSDTLGWFTANSNTGDCQAWIRLKCGYNENRSLTLHLETSNSWMLGYNTSVTFANLTNLTIGSTTASLNSGSYLEIWGEL